MQAVHLAAYEVGLRLAQAKCAVKGLYWREPTGESCYAVLGERHLQQVTFSLHALQQAFEKVLGEGAGSEVRLTAVRTLLGGCEEAVRIIAPDDEDRTPRLRQAEQTLDNNLLEVQELITESIDPLGSRKTSTALWFSLGQLVATGYWENPKPALQPRKICNAEEKVESDFWWEANEKYAQQNSPAIWVWDNNEGLTTTLQALKVKLKTVCPEMKITPEIARLLPYDPRENEIWFRIESALQRFRQALPKSNDQAERKADSSIENGTPAIPKNPKVTELLKRTAKRSKGETIHSIALELSDQNETKAKSLERQGRSFRNLWNKAER